MKTFSLSLLLSLWLALTTAQAAPFEGRVLFQRAQLPGEPDTVICAIKGDRIQWEGWHLIVTDVEERRVTRVHLSKT